MKCHQEGRNSKVFKVSNSESRKINLPKQQGRGSALIQLSMVTPPVRLEAGLQVAEEDGQSSFLKSNEEVFEQSTLSWSDYPTRSLTSHGDYQAKLSQYFLDVLRINFPSFFFYYFIYICIYVFILAVLGLHSCVWVFCRCSKRGYSLVGIHPLLTVAASLVAEHRLLGVRAQ